jgi:hypothetical protein
LYNIPKYDTLDVKNLLPLAYLLVHGSRETSMIKQEEGAGPLPEKGDTYADGKAHQ